MDEILNAAFEKLQDTGGPDVVRELIADELLRRKNLGSVTPLVC
jgi:hypothetical protein